MNSRCVKCGCSCQENKAGGEEAGAAAGGGAKPKVMNNNSRGCPLFYAKFKEETEGGDGGARMINSNIKAQVEGWQIVYAKFKEDNSCSSNEGTVTRQRSDLLPQVSPEESGQSPDHSSSVQNENERTNASASYAAQGETGDRGERGGGGGGGVSHKIERRSEGTGTTPPVRDEVKVQGAKQVSEESETETDSNDDFVPPWLRLRASAREEELSPGMKRTRDKVLDWLERNERAAAAAGEDDGAPDFPFDFVQSGPGERREETEKGRELRLTSRKKKVEEKSRRTQDVLRAGDKLAVVQGKQVEVELLSNVEYFSQFNPPLLAVTVCALLNSGGGFIYCGLDPHRVIRGLRISRAERDQARQMLDIINKDYIEPGVSPTDTDIEFMMVAGLKEDERVMKLSVRRVLTNILYRVKAVDRRGFQNGVYIRTSEGKNKHVK